MPVQKLKELLESQRVPYKTVSHARSFTAQDAAESAHVSGKELAKCVMVRIDGRLAMAVVPAASRVDFDLLKLAAGARVVELADEKEFRDRFPGCEVGAMPPFGVLYGMETYAAIGLTEHPEIAFAAGSHTEIVKLAYRDFERLARPKLARISAN